VISTNEEFDGLEAEWNSLLGEAGQPSSRPMSGRGPGGTIFRLRATGFGFFSSIGAGRRSGSAPMYVRREGFLSHLQFIGHGLSDYLDCIIRPGCEGVVFDALARHLVSTRREWDVLDIQDVNETTALLRRLPVDAGESRHPLLISTRGMYARISCSPAG